MFSLFKKIVVIISITIVALASVEAQNSAVFKRKTGHEEPYYKNKWYFGISLATTYNGFVRYGIIKVPEKGPIEVSWFPRDMFIRQANGLYFSKANPDKINYMEKY